MISNRKKKGKGRYKIFDLPLSLSKERKKKRFFFLSRKEGEKGIQKKRMKILNEKCV